MLHTIHDIHYISIGIFLRNVNLIPLMFSVSLLFDKLHEISFNGMKWNASIECLKFILNINFISIPI